ncbi:unnamed protein product [Penicillium salamii]|nr:unnamed protein product [Penicillium salamii]CAG8375993.1 unnamed protein product [Penicillium salamii]
MKLLFQLLIGIASIQNSHASFPGHTIETETHIEKRAYPLEVAGPLGVWPDARITYCFENDEARTNLAHVIPKAFDIWLAAGLNKAFKLEQGTDEECNGDDADDTLLVKYNNQRKLNTINGRIQSKGMKWRSWTTLDPVDGFATGKGVANVAHELGHAFGLGHEHQRPSLWAKNLGGDALDGNEKLHFKCENLADYASAQANSENMDSICTSAKNARERKFSALDILPNKFGEELKSDPIDWKSIMIYGSDANGKDDGNGGRAVVLTKKNGDTFGYNTAPSQKDIDAVHTLYQDSLPVLKKKSSTLFWKKGSKFRDMFSKENKQTSCD